MEIDLATRQNSHIENNQYVGRLLYKDIKDNDTYMRVYKGQGAIWRTMPTGLYNCHGLTFASKRTRIYSNQEIRKIIKEDGYKEINLDDVFPGDIILYIVGFGQIDHSGIVLTIDKIGNTKIPIILSKWGNGSEVVHAYTNCPYFKSDGKVEYYRLES
jgi:hypothetical protein